MLLLLFLTVALSFCVLQFSVNENESISDAKIHYAAQESDKPGKLHISFSQKVADSISHVFHSIRSAAKALPFFAVDMAKAVGEEVKTVFLLFGEVISSDPPGDALLV